MSGKLNWQYSQKFLEIIQKCHLQNVCDSRFKTNALHFITSKTLKPIENDAVSKTILCRVLLLVLVFSKCFGKIENYKI